MYQNIWDGNSEQLTTEMGTGSALPIKQYHLKAKKLTNKWGFEHFSGLESIL